MKRRHCFLLLLQTLFLLLHASAQSDRDLILQKIRIRYIPSPNTSAQIINIPNSRIATGTGPIFGTTSENGMDNCAAFLRQLMQPVGSGSQGVAAFQQMVAATLRITNDSVVINIYNDRATLNDFARRNLLGDPNYPDDHVWPAAWRGDASPGDAGTDHTGYVQFGEDFPLNYGGVPEMKRTIIHEIMHTQDFSDVRAHIWGRFRYGADGDHFAYELIPNMADAFGEGIANSMVYLYHAASRAEVLTWYGDNGYCAIESTIPPGSRVPAAQWVYTQVSSTNPPGPGDVPRAGDFPPGHATVLVNNQYRAYRLAQIPAQHLMHNEQIIGIIGEEYARKLGRDKYFQALRSGNGQMFRVSTSAVARWFEALGTAALPAGLTPADVAATSRSEMPYLFALALADYLTYYRASSAQAFRAMFENSLSETWADLYWTAGREIVRAQVPITLTGGNPPARTAAQVSAEINRIAAALGIRP